MRIIASSTLSGLVRNRVEARKRKAVQEQLDAWYGLVSRAAWKNSAELKEQHRSASIISSERVVFNIMGNEFRLMVAVDYAHAFVLILWLGTHREYDRSDGNKVKYE